MEKGDRGYRAIVCCLLYSGRSCAVVAAVKAFTALIHGEVKEMHVTFPDAIQCQCLYPGHPTRLFSEPSAFGILVVFLFPSSINYPAGS